MPDDFFVKPLAINLPKDGGAIRRVDEKYQVNPSSVPHAQSILIITCPSRGFAQQLAVNNDSCLGNGPSRFCWSLAHHSITRKTSETADCSNLLHQLTVIAGGVERFQELCSQQYLRRNRGFAAFARKSIKILVQLQQCPINHLSNRAQRRGSRHVLFQYHRTDQGSLVNVGIYHQIAHLISSSVAIAPK